MKPSRVDALGHGRSKIVIFSHEIGLTARLVLRMDCVLLLEDSALVLKTLSQ
jgi:hypothetical protein